MGFARFFANFTVEPQPHERIQPPTTSLETFFAKQHPNGHTQNCKKENPKADEENFHDGALQPTRNCSISGVALSLYPCSLRVINKAGSFSRLANS